MIAPNERREIQARVCVARDLLDRVEMSLVMEWDDRAAASLLMFSKLALETAQKEVITSLEKLLAAGAL